MALSHRLRRNPLDDAGSAMRVERALQEMFRRMSAPNAVSTPWRRASLAGAFSPSTRSAPGVLVCARARVPRATR